MPPNARKKIQRGIRRSDAPCSESNSQRMAVGTQSIDVRNYNDRRRECFGFQRAQKYRRPATGRWGASEEQVQLPLINLYPCLFVICLIQPPYIDFLLRYF